MCILYNKGKKIGVLNREMLDRKNETAIKILTIPMGGKEVNAAYMFDLDYAVIISKEMANTLRGVK